LTYSVSRCVIWQGIVPPASGVAYDKKLRLYRYIVFAVLLVPTSDAQKYGPVCFPDGGHPDWQLLIASLDGFCLHYPPIYEGVRFNSRVLALAQQLRPQARLLFWLTNRPFKLEELRSLTPSGEAPEPLELGGLTFYYSGSGGDQVGYSDHYFFNLRGKLLHIEVDDPYIDNPSSDDTKDSVQEILKTLRTF
jgi:hypothetical protein